MDVIEKAALLLDAAVVQNANTYILKKERILNFNLRDICFQCMVKFDLPANQERESLNRAEIILFSEEYKKFLTAFIQHRIPLPTAYKQWHVTRDNVMCLYIESQEAAFCCAARISCKTKACLKFNFSLDKAGFINLTHWPNGIFL